MNNLNNKTIEQRLKNLPKPNLQKEVKNQIYFSLMNESNYVHMKNQKWRFTIKKLSISLLGILVLSIFSFGMISSMLTGSTKNSKTNSSFLTTHNDELNIKNIMPYRESYVGDNSAVASIMHQLPGNQYVKELSLSTKKEPYGITVTYGFTENNKNQFDKYWTTDNTKRIFLYNATAFFILVRNVSVVSFDLKTPDQQISFSITRHDLEQFYKTTLRDLSKDSAKWEEIVIHNTIAKNNRVDSFYREYSLKYK